MNPFVVIALAVDASGMALVVAGVIAPGDARWGLIIAGAALSFFGTTMFLLGSRTGRFLGVRPRLLRRGTPAAARVEGARPLGIVLAGAPVVEFTLVASRDGADHRVVVSQAVPRSLLDAARPGATLGIAVDPAFPDRMAIDWSVPPRPGREPAASPAPSRQEGGAGTCGGDRLGLGAAGPGSAGHRGHRRRPGRRPSRFTRNGGGG